MQWWRHLLCVQHVGNGLWCGIVGKRGKLQNGSCGGGVEGDAVKLASYIVGMD